MAHLGLPGAQHIQLYLELGDALLVLLLDELYFPFLLLLQEVNILEDAVFGELVLLYLDGDFLLPVLWPVAEILQATKMGLLDYEGVEQEILGRGTGLLTSITSGSRQRHFSTKVLKSWDHLSGLVRPWGGVFLIMNMALTGWMLAKGGSPSASSTAVMPRLQMSVFLLYLLCEMSSGDIQ